MPWVGGLVCILKLKHLNPNTSAAMQQKQPGAQQTGYSAAGSGAQILDLFHMICINTLPLNP